MLHSVGFTLWEGIRKEQPGLGNSSLHGILPWRCCPEAHSGLNPIIWPPEQGSTMLVCFFQNVAIMTFKFQQEFFRDMDNLVSILSTGKDRILR